MKPIVKLKSWWQKIRGNSAATPATADLVLTIAEAQCVAPIRPQWQSVRQAGSKRLVDRLPPAMKAGVIVQLQMRTPYDVIARDLSLRGFYISSAALSSYAREVLNLWRQIPYGVKEDE